MARVSDLPVVGDMQASAPPVGLARAGVTGVHKAIRIRRGDHEILMAAEIDCAVDLARDQKGVHVPLPGAVRRGDRRGRVRGGPARRGARRPDRVPDRQAARAPGEVRIVARWPQRRRTPVTGLPTQEMVSLIGIAAATGAGSRRVVGVEATGINACPCAQGLVRGHATERLVEAGFGDDVERILELVPIATHNQRGHGTLLVGTAHELDAEDLAGIVERSMSAPVYELLKRPDELYVVEHAHLQPRFVEDSVRLRSRSSSTRSPSSTTRTSCSRVRSTSRRSTTTTSSRSAGAPPASPRGARRRIAPARQTTLEAWLSA